MDIQNIFQKLKEKDVKTQVFKFRKSQVKKINKFLRESGLNLNFEELINFIKTSIEYREYSKFIFTKSIDMIFHNLKILSKRLNMKLNEFSYLKIQKILELHYNLDDTNLTKVFRNEIKLNKKEFNFNKNKTP